uniref:Protein arginine methyltransferase 2 n=1 Tax=Myotis myotis TaxID=51298 RepID=A0A7J8A061_MYOMY|nr:protein arginine methyltransferase 2 [Myotis myotis]
MATSGDCPGSESQGREEPVEHCEQHLPEGVHPEEFVAIADYSATDETQLSFLRGEKILILRQTTADWWWGERAGYCGYIPANHLGKDLEEGDPEDTWQDEEYFGSYGTLKLHLEMLTDQPRTTKYHHVILQNRASLKDKVILDVGCGTGIISLFCAHRLDCAAEKPSVEEAHVRRSELVRHLQTGPHGAESWRKSLSDLEMTVEVLFGKQCELVGGKQSEELTPDANTPSCETCGRSLCLAGGHTLLCGPTTNARAAPPVTARVCPLEVAVFPGVHSAVHSAHLWTGWGTVLLS